VKDKEEAAKRLKTLAEGTYAVIYITESLQAQLESEIERYVSDYLRQSYQSPVYRAIPVRECIM
jgi:vacuolar-type H+-ATPase subunit F/Vma7